MYRNALTAAFLLLTASACQAESGLPSYYGGRGHWGEMTCAHRTRPFGSIVTVTHAGHSIQCVKQMSSRYVRCAPNAVGARSRDYRTERSSVLG